MAQAKPDVKFVPEQNGHHAYWAVETKDRNGATRIADKAESIEPMQALQAATVFLGLAKDAPNKRIAAMSLLALILGQYHERVAAWQGNCDTGKGLPNELKSAFLDCETDYFKQYMDKDHPDHAKFTARLPTADARGNELTVGGKLNREAQFQAFMANTRKESSYANAKTVVLGYFGYCGHLPTGTDGNLIPPEIMRVMVNNARTTEEADNSFSARLSALYRVLCADSDEGIPKPADAELPMLEAMLDEMLARVKAESKAASARAAALAKPGDVQSVADKADAAIASAKKTLESNKGGTQAQPVKKPQVKPAETTAS